MNRTIFLALAVAFGAMQTASAEDAATTASSQKTATHALPIECESYLSRVDRCMQTLGPNDPLAGHYKENLINARGQWESNADTVTVALVCHRASDAFNKTAADKKCEPLETVAATH
jgi:hypothetical protein